METFFMNTKNSKISRSHKFRYNSIDKFDLKNQITLGKMLSQFIKTISLKYQHQLGMKYLTYLMDRIIYQKYKIILNI